jgi:quercetin dioxygenase-like cupin family protein
MNVKLIGAAVIGALATAAPSLAAPKPAAPLVAAKTLAAGTMQPTTIRAKSGSMILESFKLPPGASFGWHVHGAPVAVVVTAGTLTVFDPTVTNCAPFKVSKGQSFVEPANHVHLARNDGRTTVTVYALYLGVPKTAQANQGQSEPAGCKA